MTFLPSDEALRTRPVSERVQYDTNGGCWLWTGYVNSWGYGTVWSSAAKKVRYAHRVSYEQKTGLTIPDGMDINHLCRVRCCVNPDHLEVLPRSEHMSRQLSATKTHCVRGHPLSGENIYLYANRFRQCRACRAIRDRQKKEARLK